jgi:hypothetical protein
MEIWIIILILLIAISYLTKNNLNFKNAVLKYLKSASIVFFMPYWVLIISYIIISYTIASGISNFNQKEKPNGSLSSGLANLNGEWHWHDKKQDESFWLLICTNDGKSGTYQLYDKQDQWAQNKKVEPYLRESGSFILEEGYDLYGDKAYVGINKETNQRAFVITQLENKYSSDWMLRIARIEDDMFAEQMDKLSNDCNLR